MSIQFPRGTAEANDTYTGPDGAISIDFTNEVIRVHDGSTAGGIFQVGAGSGDNEGVDLSVNYETSEFTITNSAGTNATVNSATAQSAGAMSSSDKLKLDGIEEGATTNESDAYLLNRSNHTGSQSSSTISDFDSSVISAVESGTIDFGVLQ